MGTPVAFFDLDHTLVDVNSGHLWVRHEWQTGTITTYKGLRALYWFARYAMGDDTIHAALDEAASVYTGVPEPELAGRVETWFAREIRHRLRPGAAAALAEHRSRGHRCVVATSSSQYSARCAARAFQLDGTISTVVDSVDGVLTGKVAEPGFGRFKLDRTRAWAEREGVDLAACTFYTDSYSDLTLLEQVGTPIVVNPDRRLRREAQRRTWPIVDWGKAATS